MSIDNKRLQSIMEFRMLSEAEMYGITYTKNCVDNAGNVPSTECPAEQGCFSMRLKTISPYVGRTLIIIIII